MSRFESAIEIIETLNKANYEAYIVGGYVRDYVINKQNEDIDIATNALPSIVQSLFPKTILTGVKHGTVTVVLEKYKFEVTTYRTESEYLNNRKPEEVFFVSSLEEDIKRRDFTMNALALTKDKQLIDYVSGVDDIKNQIIRTVGDPFERFNEDALRMLRAFRFVATLGFKLEEETYQGILANAHLIQKISFERVMKEMAQMLKGDFFLEAVDLMIETDFHTHLRGLSIGLFNIQKTKYKPMEFLHLLAFCAVSDCIDDILDLPIPNFMKREIRIVYEMFAVEMTHFNRLLLFRNGLENCLLVNQFNVFLRQLPDEKEDIIKEYQNMPIYKQCDLKFKGDDIIALYNREPGAWISEILDELILLVLTEQLENDYQKIRQYLLKKG